MELVEVRFGGSPSACNRFYSRRHRILISLVGAQMLPLLFGGFLPALALDPVSYVRCVGRMSEIWTSPNERSDGAYRTG